MAHLSGGVFPSTASRSSWLTDAAELPPLLRGDRACAGRTRHTGARHLGRHPPKAAVGQDLCASPPARPAARRRGAPTVVRGHRPGRGHPAGIRPSLSAVEPAAVGFSVRTQGRRSTVRPLLATRAGWWNSGRSHRPTVSETRCATVSSRRCGPPIRLRQGGAATSNAGRRWWLRRSRPTQPTWLAARRRRRRLDRRRRCAAGRTRTRRTTVCRRPAQPVVGQRASGLGPRPGGGGAAPDASTAEPPRPACVAGQHIHAWVQRFFRSARLFDLGDLPGAADSDVGDTEELAALQAAFGGSQWAARTPSRSRCRSKCPSPTPCCAADIDAVFADPDGGATVVDWKTGEPPRGPEALGRPPCSSLCTGWRGPRCPDARNPRYAPPSTTCAPGSPSFRMTCPIPPR